MEKNNDNKKKDEIKVLDKNDNNDKNVNENVNQQDNTISNPMQEETLLKNSEKEIIKNKDQKKEAVHNYEVKDKKDGNKKLGKNNRISNNEKKNKKEFSSNIDDEAREIELLVEESVNNGSYEDEKDKEFLSKAELLYDGEYAKDREWNGYYLNIKQIYLIVAISAAVGD